ncbi:SDR family NAD(P)-dependent oxidoreductase [Actinoalloteichus fjordicus]|uniref:Short-chain alcohol dehydrogenase n=1 Tax=Actinoalloteichus fjordicus TaxID=1612552 RepID=A0AAC9LBD0_9PSEU|nr:SDR family NAD(P)-dependent oxidoreductase [Actinoalloteichus fjordicus]APU13577.1 short-chain alcohol dehydrogenase [Actinoalloteichus fjordicus]
MTANAISRPGEPRPSRVWFITGAASGFGLALAEAAVAAGDFVVATARRPESLAGLVAGAAERVTALPLDVTDPEQVDDAVSAALARFGRIDVLVNNAGFGHVGAAEETTDAELRDLLDVHLHGPAALVRAVLPSMRIAGGGAIVQMSSFVGQLGYSGFSAYCAAKFALEGYSEALAAEVAPFGIRVIIVEPGAFRTAFAGAALRESRPLPAYTDITGPARTLLKNFHGAQPGDPVKAAAVIRTALDAERPPLRLALGGDAVDLLAPRHRRLLAELDEWGPLARTTAIDAA